MSAPARFVIITGLSGAGKSLAANCFEDMGYYCVDNLPLKLIPVLCDLIARSGSRISKVALVIDIREGAFLEDFPEMMERMRADGRETFILFLDCADPALVRRFSETRRPHPLSDQGSLEEGIRNERRALRSVRDQADKIIDTSQFNVHELRAYLHDSFSEESRQDALFVSMVSFGYKHGVPVDSDMIFDVRFLPNPHFQEHLRGMSGLDPEAMSFIESGDDFREYYERVSSLLTFLMPRFVKEGKTYLTVAVGCTGGRHRSVAIAHKLGEDLRRSGYRVRTVHRDMSKGAKTGR
jgi:UPF0042 nucleotide-binding protein